MRILVVEDERSLARAIVKILEKGYYSADSVGNGADALEYLDCGNYDAVILDVMMPVMDGITALKKIRERGNGIPVLVLTAKSEVDDKVRGLDMGADDYLTKPFGPGELLARIRAALRHVRTAAGGEVGRTGVYRCGDLEVDCVRRRVRINGEDIHLTQSEYRILSLLTRHAGKVLTYDFILRELWGPSAGGSNQILRVNVANIRRKIEKNPAEPKYIFTEIGVGYRMTDADATDEPEQ